ncbi:hypothetical protein ACFSQP_00455 [Bizionia sediminis]|uniref:Uncharacterized protein n=1 Tax=Bizionia sediminis TaxID=1737064 RepID=A0ABW5KMR8_9FLAO
MKTPIASSLFQSPIYQKAIDIMSLSHSISNYLHQDLAHLQADGSENAYIYFSGDIIQQSVSLAPEIAKAEEARFSDKKYKHIATVKRLTRLLNKTIKRLEQCNSNGKDYLPLLRSELKKFKQLQHTWTLTL